MNDSFRLWIHLYNNNTKVGKPKTRKDDAIQHENCSATAPFKIKKNIIPTTTAHNVYKIWMLKNIPM